MSVNDERSGSSFGVVDCWMLLRVLAISEEDVRRRLTETKMGETSILVVRRDSKSNTLKVKAE